MSGKRSRIAVAVAVAQVAQRRSRSRLDAPPAAIGRVELASSPLPTREPGAVVEQHVERLDVVGGDAGQDRVHAAGVVADHAAERAAAVRGGIGAEGEVVLLGGARAGGRARCRAARARSAALGVELEDPRQVLAEVDQHGVVDGLAGEAGAGAAGERSGAPCPRQSATVAITSSTRAGHHDAERDLTVDRGVVGVQRAAAVAEADLAARPPRSARARARAVEPASRPRGRGRWRSMYRGRSVGRVAVAARARHLLLHAAPAPRTGSPARLRSSQQLAADRERDLAAMLLAAARARRRTASPARGVIFGGMRRLVRVGHALDHAPGPSSASACAQLVAGSGSGRRSGPPAQPQPSATLTKSTGVKSHAVLGVAEEDHLLPLDQPQRVVLEHDHLHRQLAPGRASRGRPSSWSASRRR